MMGEITETMRDGNVVHEEEAFIEDNLAGPIDEVIAYLEDFRKPGREDIRIVSVRGYDDSYLSIKWRRTLSPEEIAKRERDERERSANHAAQAAAEERALFERLKAKYEPR